MVENFKESSEYESHLSISVVGIETMSQAGDILFAVSDPASILACKRFGHRQASLVQREGWTTKVSDFKVPTSHYGKAPFKEEAKITHPFHLAPHTCYLHVIPFLNSGLNWIMHKSVGLPTAQGRLHVLTAHPLTLLT